MAFRSDALEPNKDTSRQGQQTDSPVAQREDDESGGSGGSSKGGSPNQGQTSR